MLVLFDQGTPIGIRDSIAKHTVRTARQQGWSDLSNGDLLRAAEDAGLDVLVTTDKNLAYQQNLRNRKIGIVVLGNSRWTLVQPALLKISATIDASRPGSYSIVEVH